MPGPPSCITPEVCLGDEMRALRKQRRDYPQDAYVFVSERGGSITIGFHRLIQRVGEAAKMPFPIHPHMLRHACGFKLASEATTRGRCSTTSGLRTHGAHSRLHCCLVAQVQRPSRFN